MLHLQDPHSREELHGLHLLHEQAQDGEQVKVKCDTVKLWLTTPPSRCESIRIAGAEHCGLS